MVHNTNLAKKINERLSTFKTLRKPHEAIWRDCFDYSFLVRGTGFTNDNSNIINADTIQHKKARLFDTTLTDAVRTQASAIISGLTPADARWFGLDVDQATDD